VARLEDLRSGATVRGVIPSSPVTVVSVDWIGDAIGLTYRDVDGRPGNVLLFRDAESLLEIVTPGQAWDFSADGELLRLVSEAHRIRLAHLFDPHLAVHTSDIEPLPHQITAVYEEMLTRQPLRFLLADDPGAGKTIMTGLLIKELILRGDLQRCLIVCPGSLVEQWQDELRSRFGLRFEILTSDKLEAAGENWFAETPLAIARLDKLSRDERTQAMLQQTDWDLIVCDEAHKMSATYFGSEAKYTKRYHLGQLLSGQTRNFLLLTATPHNGKEPDFQLFMGLLDADRFEGKYRPAAHTTDASDMMRRLQKESLLTFEGKPLFPERRATTVQYALSDAEALLYKEVTDYVREQFNLADALQGDGRKGTIGFALTVLQRRLASSPEAIYQSLRRRRERLAKRLDEARLLKRGADLQAAAMTDAADLSPDDLDDLDDAPDAEIEAAEERVVERASAARTIAELEREIAILARLEALALRVRLSGADRKWDELSRLLQDSPEVAGDHAPGAGHRHKLVIFTEHRDTLNYLEERIGNLLGRPDAVATIHGGLGREQRRDAQDRFLQDKDVPILLATDAAGEGINLQRAHLMVNYDLPWNPNRLEQRFGRIHRIGQTEVCHLWNLVASETREGAVYSALLRKLEQERAALGGQVFDVLGQLSFDDRPLRELLIEAIRYGDRLEVRERLDRVVDEALDREHLRDLLERRAIATTVLDANRVFGIREEMERAAARRLQPHFIAAFFLAAFRHLGGTIHEREPRRYEITSVPGAIRERALALGGWQRVQRQYERVTFDKSLTNQQPVADFISPGHPLLAATIDLVLERYRPLLKQGAILVDPSDDGEPRALFSLEHAIEYGSPDASGRRAAASRQLQFVEIAADGSARQAGPAPYLDYRPLTDEERALIASRPDAVWSGQGLPAWPELEAAARRHAVQELVPRHLEEVRRRRSALIEKAKRAVHERLTKEAIYWDHRAVEIRYQEEAGKTPKLNSTRARQRADELRLRLARRMAELEEESHLSALPPHVIGGALVVPAGLLRRLDGDTPTQPSVDAAARARIERAAMDAVLAAESALGHEPRDVSAAKLGYDIESRIRGTGKLRFIEVKGRAAGAASVTVTKNEILTALNKPEDFILALVEVDGHAASPRYVRKPFRKEPDFHATAVIYPLAELLKQSEAPA
jgi:SNF2 family DNA or RNA helicase